jgi:hypothetical protein
MRIRLCTLPVVLLVAFINFTPAALARGKAEALARRAISENASEAGAAIAELRALGPEGLQALLDAYDAEIKRHLAEPAPAAAPYDSAWRRISFALDAVSQQYDSYASRLYWYTDLEQAKAAARASGKPILSLRLLGNLNEELSCANSRFFRTALYANADISRMLRERFILHWKSVRPAPRVEIDFGDGRKLVRTITGNSIHYVLDPSGEVIDALPGLYGPQAFMRELTRADNLVRQISRLPERGRRDELRRFYNINGQLLIGAWSADLARVGVRVPPVDLIERARAERPPSARVAARAAMTKMTLEIPVVEAMTPYTKPLETVTDDEVWAKIAALHAGDARLDPNSIALIQRQYSFNGAGGRDGLARMVRNFERTMALDTVRNEYLLRTKLYDWLIKGAGNGGIEALNERVYAELFLTPRTDPWLGLVPADTYAGIENGGMIR